MSQSKELRCKAIEALTTLLAFVIRDEMEDPDHSGPDDAAETLAIAIVDNTLAELRASDWRSFLE